MPGEGGTVAGLACARGGGYNDRLACARGGSWKRRCSGCTLNWSAITVCFL